MYHPSCGLHDLHSPGVDCALGWHCHPPDGFGDQCGLGARRPAECSLALLSKCSFLSKVQQWARITVMSCQVGASQVGRSGKEPACQAGDVSSIPGSGRSPGGGHGNPLQDPCLENPVDRGAWQGPGVA